MTVTTAALHPAYAVGAREFTVDSVVEAAPGIVHVELVSADGAALASYQPGSHLIVTAGEVRNAYSLTGDGFAPTSYGISVLRHGAGGGSDWIHENLSVGAKVVCEGPRSNFAFRPEQRKAVLVAGGIGITPILSHARALARWGGDADIIYSYREDAGAHLEELRDLARVAGFRLFEAHTPDAMRELLAARFAEQPIGAHAYACGPIGMLDSYLELGRAAGWLDQRLHLERFEAPELDPGFDFQIRVEGRELNVPSGVSVLESLLEAGYQVPNLCRQGVCGECRIGVASGVLEHRDYVLTDEEKTAGDAMMACVSRGENIEVELP